MGLVPYNFGPHYSVEEINHRQHLNNSATRNGGGRDPGG
jgi:hypothetical protein